MAISANDRLAALGGVAGFNPVGVSNMLGWGEDFALGDSGVQMPPLWPYVPPPEVIGNPKFSYKRVKAEVLAVARQGETGPWNIVTLPDIHARLMGIFYDDRYIMLYQLAACDVAEDIAYEYPGI